MKKLSEVIRPQKREEGHNENPSPSWEYIAMICRIYGDIYDDREEDSRIKGLDWKPVIKANHKSMAAFQKELEEIHGIYLSRTKLQKILITGNCWTTERSREIQWLYEEYIAPPEQNGKNLEPDIAVRAIGEHLGIEIQI